MTSTDTQEALDDAMFALSARLKLSGFLDDDANHAAYERVVAVWTNRRTPPTPATDEREAVARALFRNDDKYAGMIWAHTSDRLQAMFRDDADAALSALAPIRAAEILAAERERDALREALRNALASLVAATSLLERGGKKAAPSDKMFAQMLVDYNKSAARARAALTANHSAPVVEE